MIGLIVVAIVLVALLIALAARYKGEYIVREKVKGRWKTVKRGTFQQCHEYQKKRMEDGHYNIEVVLLEEHLDNH